MGWSKDKMSRFRDIDSVGNSKAIPFIKHESPKDRHARRKAHNLRLREQTKIFCDENKIKLQITNEGHHWRAEKDDMIIEWWPSSAKVVVNKSWKRGIHVHDIYQFQKLLKKRLLK